MKKFQCPYCHEHTISRFKKAFAGTYKSKGVKCPNCGKHCVNGKQSIIFRTAASALAFLIILLMIFLNTPNAFFIAIILLVADALLIKFFDAFFFELDKTWRIDV